jgi:hypothetical protein
MTAPDPADVDPIVDTIWPTVSAALAGKDPQLQGAVLADLVATWLAGFTGELAGDVAKVREELLALHAETVRALIPVNERKMLERRRR